MRGYLSRLCLGLAALGLSAFLASSACADMLEFGYGGPSPLNNQGLSPLPSANAVTATFLQDGSNKVELEISASGLSSSDILAGLWINVNSSITSITVSPVDNSNSVETHAGIQNDSLNSSFNLAVPSSSSPFFQLDSTTDYFSFHLEFAAINTTGAFAGGTTGVDFYITGTGLTPSSFNFTYPKVGGYGSGGQYSGA